MRREVVTIGTLRGPWSTYRARRSMRAVTIGQISPDIQIAAEALANHFSAHAPTQGQNNGLVANFQAAWNSAPLAGSGIDVDDEYGPNTQVAFAMSLQAEGYPYTAPQNAYSNVLPSVPGRSHPAPVTPPSPVVPGPSPVAPSGGDGWLLPVALAGGAALVLYLIFRKKKRAPATLEIRRNPRRSRSLLLP